MHKSVHRLAVTGPRRAHAGGMQVGTGQSFPWRVYLGRLHVGHRICPTSDVSSCRRWQYRGPFGEKERARGSGIHQVTNFFVEFRSSPSAWGEDKGTGRRE
ncbi:hypothetical protein GCM10017790_40950 [Amycolatopsis oliviviridis]|uniref:Uncharacterized protein n=1 Tax=Amycolatopsis oliviviridis TaxID=1471590 RepID=A0ABQ3LMR2_9PSEU|nr:hypothetical protein GCM10017790_40950 [Amycolatopsis oliviviridis]